MQSGTATTHRWVLDYEPETPRTPDPLMGWSRAGDTLNQIQLKFATLGEAIAYAKKKGLDYTVSAPHDIKVRPKSYADNFRYNRPG